MSLTISLVDAASISFVAAAIGMFALAYYFKIGSVTKPAAASAGPRVEVKQMPPALSRAKPYRLEVGFNAYTLTDNYVVELSE